MLALPSSGAREGASVIGVSSSASFCTIEAADLDAKNEAGREEPVAVLPLLKGFETNEVGMAGSCLENGEGVDGLTA